MQELFSVSHIQHLVCALLLLIVGFYIAKKVSRISENYSKNRFSNHHAALIRQLVFYIILVAFLISALQQLGFNLTVLIGAAGVLSVALGFASQTVASNFISGIFLIFERPFSLDDFIELKGHSGTVTAIDLLSTKIRTTDNKLVRIPNETMIKSEVINYNAYKTRRIDLIVGISYDNNIAKAHSLLLEIATEDKNVLTKPTPSVRTHALADSQIELKLMAWVKSSNYVQTKSTLQETIKLLFNQNNIEIPFKQLTIHRAKT